MRAKAEGKEVGIKQEEIEKEKRGLPSIPLVSEPEMMFTTYPLPRLLPDL